MATPKRTPAAATKRSAPVRRSLGPTFIGRSRSVSSEEKAVFHNVLGAGRRGVIRKFFDLGEQRQQAARDVLQRLVSARLAQQQN